MPRLDTSNITKYPVSEYCKPKAAMPKLDKSDDISKPNQKQLAQIRATPAKPKKILG